MPLPPKPPALDVLGWEAPSTSSTSEPTIPGAIVLSSDAEFWELHDVVRTLGKGSFGEVRLVRIRSTGALVAVKIIAKSSVPADECYGAVDARNEPKILMEVQRKFDSAPARIGGRRRQRLGMTPPPSLLQLQDALRAPAVDAAMPLPLSASAAPRHGPGHRRTMSLGKDMDVAAGTRPQTLPGRRNTQKSRARPSAMSLWELQEALGEQGAPGSCEEDAMMASAAEPEATQQQQRQQRWRQPQPQQPQQLQHQVGVSLGEDGGGGGGGAPEEGEGEEGEGVGEGEGEGDSVRLLEVYDAPATLFMVMRAELGGDLESRSLSPQPSSPPFGPRPKPSPPARSSHPHLRLASLPGRVCAEDEARMHVAAILRALEQMRAEGIRTRRPAPLASAFTLTALPDLPPSPATLTCHPRARHHQARRGGGTPRHQAEQRAAQ